MRGVGQAKGGAGVHSVRKTMTKSNLAVCYERDPTVLIVICEADLLRGD